MWLVDWFVSNVKTLGVLLTGGTGFYAWFSRWLNKGRVRRARLDAMDNPAVIEAKRQEKAAHAATDQEAKDALTWLKEQVSIITAIQGEQATQLKAALADLADCNAARQAGMSTIAEMQRQIAELTTRQSATEGKLAGGATRGKGGQFASGNGARPHG